MMMIVDTNSAKKPFDVMTKEFDELSEVIGVAIKCQREDIFNKMHRI